MKLFLRCLLVIVSVLFVIVGSILITDFNIDNALKTRAVFIQHKRSVNPFMFAVRMICRGGLNVKNFSFYYNYIGCL